MTKDVVRRISANWQAVAALVAAATLGAMVAGRVSALDLRVTALESGYGRIICLLGMTEEERVAVASNVFTLDTRCPR